MDDWFDTDIAPKDGTWIIGWSSKENRPVVVQWKIAEAFGWSDWYDGEYRRPNEIFHWQHAPKPPKAAQ